MGAAARHLRVRWYLVPFLQLLVVTAWLHQRQHADTLLGSWLPTPDGVRVLARQVRSGADAINTYAAPVSADYGYAPLYLLVCAIGVLVLVDLVACGLRHPAWAGLPVLVAVTGGIIGAVLAGATQVERRLHWLVSSARRPPPADESLQRAHDP